MFQGTGVTQKRRSPFGCGVFAKVGCGSVQPSQSTKSELLCLNPLVPRSFPPLALPATSDRKWLLYNLILRQQANNALTIKLDHSGGADQCLMAS